MKKFITIIILLFAVQAVFAKEKKDGFSGYFDAGVLGISSNDALMTSGNNEDIDTLSDNPDSFNNARIIALFDLKYRDGNLIYHAGTPLESANPKLLVGATFENGRSKTDLSIIFDIFGSEWEDPYIEDRDKTESVSVGARLKMDAIGGTPFGLEATIMDTDVDKDVIGRRFSDMRRDGGTFKLQGNYKIPVGQKKVLTPYIEYKKENRLGDAASSDAVFAGAKYFQATSKGFIMPAVSIYTEEFDAENPIFGKTRKDTGMGAFLMYKHYFTKKFHTLAVAGVSIRESNIDFYDAETFFAGITAGFDF